ncbi:MAG: Stp1/IreP family PP2C-type Ser/Thr phosphatase [Enterocloster asparagiformis]|nr:Stp1/IreP family PP2C-type Ser/Thr phosphatase [Enterocloster asparagiformis]
MESYALTDVGRVRAMNQDYIYASPEPVGTLPNLFLVADGMGGHRAGDYASRYMVENLVIYLNKHRGNGVVGQLKNAIDQVNRGLYQESLSQEEFYGMGCTLVAGVVEDNTLYVANVGDSRLYLIHGNLIHQVTRDHSYVEEMVAMGQMERDSAAYNRQKNIITRAMGISEAVDTDFFEVDLEPGDYFLLCSDGLTNMVEDRDICRIVSGPGTMREKASALIAEANRRGGNDNIAVVLVKPLESGVTT